MSNMANALQNLAENYYICIEQ
eukprot:COSAG02_NODE_43643_length_373_cov_0.565693_1_plen_21_part_10